MSRRHSRVHRTRIPRWRSSAKYFGFGEQVEDGISGVSHPKVLMMRQCGHWVRRDWNYGSRDWCDELDKKSGGCCATALMKPYVTVAATDSAADESGGTGTFTLTRTGRTDRPITVYYVLSGTAAEGTDYPTISSHTVQFAAGETEKTITVTPSADSSTEGSETIVLTLTNDPVFSYDLPVTVADGRAATVTISDTSAGVSLLLAYSFETSPGMLVNEGTLGTSYNVSQGDVCEV